MHQGCCHRLCRRCQTGERESTSEEHTDDDATEPYVGFDIIASLISKQLGRCVLGRAAELVPQLVAARAVCECAEPEAHHLEIANVDKEAVLRLEVMLEHVVCVAEIHDGDELAAVVVPHAHLPAPGAHDPAKKLAAIGELERGSDLGAGCESMRHRLGRVRRGRCRAHP
jgi:hypothetical protein